MKPVSIRCFLIAILTVTLILAPGGLKAKDRPNILFAFADDWGRYASVYSEVKTGTVNDVIDTPHFDRIAKEGVLFKNAHVTSPSCTPCRSALLSGQYFYRTGRAAILQGAIWDSKIPTFPLMLRDHGYHIGKVYKVWTPGTPRDAPFGEQTYSFQTKGPNFSSFSQTATRMVSEGSTVEEAKATMLAQVKVDFEGFLEAQPEDQPFLYWFGPTNVHRKWIQGSGKALWGIDPDGLEGKMPGFLPDVHDIREDFADYLGEVVAFDAGLGVLLEVLEAQGSLENTLVVVSGDHGAPGFPRGKCNLYDFGTGVALAARWGDGIPGGRVVDDFVNLMDLCPTFLEAGGVEVPEIMTGRSLMNVFTSDQTSGLVDPERTWVVTGRERHVAAAREDFLPYPQRAIRTSEHLYVVNFEPDRWPMGSPGPVAEDETPEWDALVNNTFACFGDLDASPTKAWMIVNRNKESVKEAYELGFGKRPERELYVLSSDPDEMNNRAGEAGLAEIEATLHRRLMEELESTLDPRVTEDPVPYELPPFTDEFKR
ncbi:MAG: sulfatase [Verrucomicrobiota bacterium]